MSYLNKLGRFARTTIAGLSATALVLSLASISPVMAQAPAPGEPATVGSLTPAAAATNVLALECHPNVMATKTASLFSDADHNGLVTPGDTLLYRINIVNNGQASATGVVFSDTLDLNTSLVVGSVTTTHGTIVKGNNPGNTLVYVNIGELKADKHAAVSISFQAIIAKPFLAMPRQVSNQGVVRIDQLDKPILTDDPSTPAASDPTITRVHIPGLLVAIKTSSPYADANGDGQVSPGDTLQYTIHFNNVGGEAVTDTVLLDNLDPNTVLVTGSVQTTSGAVVAGNRPYDTFVLVNVGTVQPSEGEQPGVTITFLAVIANPFPPDVSQVENLGIISFSGGVTTTYNSDNVPGPDIVPVHPVVVLSLSATAPQCVQAGTIFSLTWVFTNTGNTAFTNGILTTTVTGSGTGSAQQAIANVPASGSTTLYQPITVIQPVAYGAETITVTGQALDTSTTTAIHICAPDLRATVATVTSTRIFAQELLSYTWLLKNTGDADAIGAHGMMTPTTLLLHAYADQLTSSSGLATWNAAAQRVEWSGDLRMNEVVTVTFSTQSIFGLPHRDLMSLFDVSHSSRPTFYGSANYIYPYKLFFMLVLRASLP